VTAQISPPPSRRRFVLGLALAGGAAAIGAPIWTRAQGGAAGPGVLTGDRFDLTVGAGLSRSAYAIPVGDIIPILQVDDFTRWTVDVPVLVGTSRSWYRIWAGPKLLWSHFATALRLSIPGGDTELASFEGQATYVGGQAGLALGYRHLFFGVELTLAEMFGSASVTATSLPAVRPVDFSGFVVYPAFGLLGEI